MNNLWRNSLIILTLTSMSLAAHAQRRRHNTSLELDIQDKIAEVNQITARLERALPNMRTRRMRNINAKLDEVLAILKTRGPVQPVPTPGPYPGPTPAPYPGSVMTVTGAIENVPFMYDVVDAADLATQCIAATSVGNVDEITISVDFGPSQKFTTPGWWRGEGEACGQLAEKAIQLGLPPKQTSGYMAVGSIENKSFSFSGYSLRDIMVQCTDMYNNSNLGNVDEMTIFNGSTITKETTPGWWRNSGEVCNVLVQHVR